MWSRPTIVVDDKGHYVMKHFCRAVATVNKGLTKRLYVHYFLGARLSLSKCMYNYVVTLISACTLNIAQLHPQHHHTVLWLPVYSE